jgi:hypothetical protein
MTALAPWNWEIGSTAIESAVSRFWRFAGGGEAIGEDGERQAGSTFFRSKLRCEICERHGAHAFSHESGTDKMRLVKTMKDVGSIVSWLTYYKDESEVTTHKWSSLEDVLLNDDCINQLNRVLMLEET